MKITLQILSIFSILICAAGCSTPYMKDRSNDALDIFNVTVGTGGGAAFRIGPLPAGVAYIEDKAGLRGGEWSLSTKSSIADFPLPVLIGPCAAHSYAELYIPSSSWKREKGYGVSSFFPFIANDTYVYYGETETYPNSRAYIRPYYSDIEVAFGVGGTLRLGCNPVEIVDFILGWTTLDIYDDDIWRMEEKEKNKSNKTTLGDSATVSPLNP